MVTETAPELEQAIPEPTSEGTEPEPSNAGEPTPSSVEEGAEPQVTEGAKEPAPQESPRPRTAAELERIVVDQADGNIDRALRLGLIEESDAPRLRDRIADTVRREREEAEEFQRRDAAINQGFPALKDGIVTDVAQKFGIDLSDERDKVLLEKVVEDRLASFSEIMEPAILSPINRQLRNTLLSERLRDFTEVTPEQAQRMDWANLTRALMQANTRWAMSQDAVQGPALEALKAQHEAQLKERDETHLAEMNELRSQYGILPANNGGNTSTNPDGIYTLAQIEAMPNTQWLSIGASDADGGHARRQQMLDDARTRASRR